MNRKSNSYLWLLPALLAGSLLFSLSSCQTTPKALPVFNPAKVDSGRMVLSDIATGFRYVPLSNEIPIRMINRVVATDSLYFIGAPQNEILVFDAEGKFQHKIGGLGNGPGEYHFSSAFTVDPEKKIVYLLDQNRLLEYNFDGQFLQETPLQKWGNDFQEIRYRDHLIYLFEPLSFGHAKYDWLILNEKGEAVGQKMNAIPQVQSQMGGNCYAFGDGNHLYYTNAVNDTVFSMEGKEWKARCLFKLSNDKATQNPGAGFNLLDIVSSGPDWFLRYFFNGKFYLTAFNLRSGKFQVVGQTSSLSSRDGGPGLADDLDGGLPFVPKFSFTKNGNDWICGYRYSYELRNYVASNSFQKAVVKYPNKKKQLEKLANSLSENDNPVLMLVKMK